MTVVNKLNSAYSVKYGVDFGVVRNVPDKDLDEEEYSIPEEYIKSGFLIYQGAVNKDRGLEELIDIVYEIKEFRLMIVGDGDVINTLRQKVSDLKLEDFVYFTGKIEPSKLKSVTRKALLGLSLEKKTNLNYYYALPNKLFDYIRAGIPVLCSDFPEMRKIIDSYQVGRVADPDDRNEIKQLIKLMISDNERRQEWIKNTSFASEELSWNIEQNQLYGIYKKVGIDLQVVSEKK
jgi:glycosyltransferase involved in cell wall biosynthesis